MLSVVERRMQRSADPENPSEGVFLARGCAMNSTFSEKILEDELSKLNSTRQSIQTLSFWCIFHRKDAELIVQMWNKKFHGSPKEKKILFLYLANDILQNGRQTGPEFVGRFWKVLPAALMDVIKNGSDFAKNAGARLINIWMERKVFGSRSRELRDSILGNEPLPALGWNKNHSGSCVIRDCRTVRTELSAFHIVVRQPNENVDMNKCKNAIRRVEELEKNINYACSRAGDPRKETLTIELVEQETTLKQCIEKLKSVEASRAALISQLKEALKEQESKLETVRTQIQVAEGTLEIAANMQRQLNNEAVVIPAKRPLSAEALEPNSNYPAVQPQNSSATIEGEIAFKFSASTNFQQMKASIPSTLAAEEAKSADLVRSADLTVSFSEGPGKKMKLEEPTPIYDPSAAAAFVPVQEMAFPAPHQPQPVPVQQTPIQNQALATQPQYNIYQVPTMQYLEPSGGVMIGLFGPYNAPPPTELPLPQMTNMIGTESFILQQQQQQQYVAFQQLPSPTPPQAMLMNEPFPINQQPIGQPMPINQQPAQFNIRKPLAPSYRPLMPDSMAFYHPQN